MRPYCVAVDAPGLEDPPSLGQRGEDVFVEAALRPIFGLPGVRVSGLRHDSGLGMPAAIPVAGNRTGDEASPELVAASATGNSRPALIGTGNCSRPFLIRLQTRRRLRPWARCTWSAVRRRAEGLTTFPRRYPSGPPCSGAPRPEASSASGSPPRGRADALRPTLPRRRSSFTGCTASSRRPRAGDTNPQAPPHHCAASGSR